MEMFKCSKCNFRTYHDIDFLSEGLSQQVVPEEVEVVHVCTDLKIEPPEGSGVVHMLYFDGRCISIEVYNSWGCPERATS